MKKWLSLLTFAGMLVLVGCASGLIVRAKANPDSTILQGVFAGSIDLSGMTKDEATAAVQSYVDSLQGAEITLKAVEGNEVTVTAAELGMKWSNTNLVDDAVNLGKRGNVVVRYKELKDLEHINKVYDISFDFDQAAIAAVVESQCDKFNVEAVDAHLKREGGKFIIEDGQTGVVVDNAASETAIYEHLVSAWNQGDDTIELVVTEEKPKGNAEDLAKVKDVLGTFTTSFSSSGKDRSANVTNGCKLIDGHTLFPGETFSTYEAVAPFSQENGYYLAGSYLNGQVVDSLGGGICQVSTTLYNAVLRSELEVAERHNHSMIVTYVDPSADAAIAESSGKDFKFTNNTEYPIYIEGNIESKQITFTIYGVETRDLQNRKVTYESEVLERNVPDSETIIQSSSQPIGYVDVQSAHVGYKARLWKVVTVNGVEESREQVNSSNYKMVPRTATVGVSTSDPNALSQLQAAIATGSINEVKSVASALASGQPTTPPPAMDPALAALLIDKTPEEQAAIVQQYNAQLAQQQNAQPPAAPETPQTPQETPGQ